MVRRISPALVALALAVSFPACDKPRDEARGAARLQEKRLERKAERARIQAEIKARARADAREAVRSGEVNLHTMVGKAHSHHRGHDGHAHHGHAHHGHAHHGHEHDSAVDGRSDGAPRDRAQRPSHDSPHE